MPNPIKDQTFTISGTITTTDQVPPASLTIIAYDQFLSKRKVLGKAQSAKDGTYQIKYKQSDIQAGKNKADIVLEVSEGKNRPPLLISSLFTDAPPHLEVPLVIERPGKKTPARFAILAEKMAGFLAQAKINSLPKRDIVSLSEKDTAYLAQKLTLPAEQVTLFQKAHTLSEATGVQEQVWFGLLQQRMPAELPGYADLDRDKLIHTLQKAVRENQVALQPEEIDRQVDLLQAAAIDAVYDEQHPLVQLAQLAGYTKQADRPNDQQVRKFIHYYVKNKPHDEAFWTSVNKDLRISKAKTAGLRFALQLSELTDGRLAVVEKIQAKGITDLRGLVGEDIPGLVTEAMGKDGDHAVVTAKLESAVEGAYPTAVFADQLQNTPNGFPTNIKHDLNAFFAHHTDFDFRNTNVTQYLKDRPGALNIPKVADPSALERDLKAIQRLFNITPDSNRYNAVSVLYNQGLDSAHRIHRMGRYAFVKRYTQLTQQGHASQNEHELTEQQANEIFNQAQQVALGTQLIYSKYGRAFNEQPMYVLPPLMPPPRELPNREEEKVVANWRTLFDALDYWQCEHCQSAYSPAAYLADLLIFLENATLKRDPSGHEQAVLPTETSFLDILRDERRPDIVNLLLNCENALTEMPHIDLVLEVLENAVAKLSGRHRYEITTNHYQLSYFDASEDHTISSELRAVIFTHTGIRLEKLAKIYTREEHQEWTIIDQGHVLEVKKVVNGRSIVMVSYFQTANTAQELAARPEHVRSAPYDALKGASYPWLLPFDLWTEETRIYLDHLGIPRFQIMELFGDINDPETELAIASEYLGLIPKEQELLTLNDPDLPPLSDSVQDIIDNTPLDYRQLSDFLQSKFINPNAKAIETHGEPNISKHTLDLNIAKLYRFWKLHHKLEWNVIELDKVIRLFNLKKRATPFIPKQTIIDIAYLLRIQEQVRLPLLPMMCWWAPMDAFDDYAGTDSLYAQWLLKPLKTRSQDQQELLEAFENAATGNAGFLLVVDEAENYTYLPTIQGVIKASQEELLIILEKDDEVFVRNDERGISLDRRNLSYLYAVISLCRSLRISVREYYILKLFFGSRPNGLSEPINTPRSVGRVKPKDTFTFIQDVQFLKNSGFSIPELGYLVKHHIEPGSSILPREEAMLISLSEMQRELSAIVTENASSETESSTSSADKPSLHLEPVPEDKQNDLPDRRTFRSYLVNKLAGTFDIAPSIVQWLLAQFAMVPYGDPKEPHWPGEAPEDWIKPEIDQYRLTLMKIAAPKSLVAAEVKRFLYIKTTDGKRRKVVLENEDPSEKAWSVDQVISYRDQISIELWEPAPRPSRPLPGHIWEPEIILGAYTFIGGQDKEQFTVKLTTKGTKETDAYLLYYDLVPCRKLDSIFFDRSFLENDHTPSASPEFFGDQIRAYRLLQKIATFMRKLHVRREDVPFIFEYGPALGWLDLTYLPEKEGNPHQVGKQLKTSHWLSVKRLIQSFQLQAHIGRFQSDRFSVIDLLQENLAANLDLKDQGSNGEEQKNKLINRLHNGLGWDPRELSFFMQTDVFHLPSYQDERFLIKLKEAFSLIDRLGGSAKQIWQLSKPDIGMLQAQLAGNLARSKYDRERRLELAPQWQNKLRKRQRDALLAYLIAESGVDTPKFQDASDVYGYYLIDPEMNPCFITSRLKQAIASVQLFVQRILMNLEMHDDEHQQLVFDPAEARQWAWRKNYRVWEANRKVFLYPENWIEPELRDDKSPFFQELEDELLQDEVNATSVERAYLHYLYKLHEVARLDVRAEYYDDDTHILHVFARTYSEPHVYYYRTWTEGRNGSGIWSPWEKVDVDIEGDHLVPVVYHGKLMLFWPTFLIKSNKEKKIEVGPDSDENNVEENPKIHVIKLNWTKLGKGGWSVKRSSRSILDTSLALNTLRKHDVRWGKILEFKPNYHFEVYKGDEFIEIKIMVRDFVFYTDDAVKDLELPYFVFKPKTEKINVEPESDYCKIRQIEHTNLSIRNNKLTGKLRFTRPNLIFTIGLDRNFIETHKPINLYLFLGGKMEELIIEKESEVHGDILLTLVEDDVNFNKAVIANYIIIKPTQDIIFYKKYDFYVDHNSQPKFLSESGGDFNPSLKETAYLPYYPDTHHLLEEYGIIAPKSDNFNITASNFRRDFVWQPFFYEDESHSFFVSRNDKWKFSTFEHPCIELLLKRIESGIHRLDYFLWIGEPSVNDLPFEELYPPLENLDGKYPEYNFDFSPDGSYSTYNWELFFHIPMLIACRLSQNQKFAEAQKWFHYIFDPTCTDTTNIKELGGDPATQPFLRFWKLKPFIEAYSGDQVHASIEALFRAALGDDLAGWIADWEKDPFNPHLIARGRTTAYMKAVVIKYLDNLIAWGDQLFRRESIESINEATQLYVLAAEILGRRPQELSRKEQPKLAFADVYSSNPLEIVEDLVYVFPFSPPPNAGYEIPDTLNTIFYFCLPRNEYLEKYWNTVADRLFKIRNCMNIEGTVRRLALYEPPIDPGLLVRAAAAGVDLSTVLNDLNVVPANYRFQYLLQKALDFSNELSNLGGALLSALEKKDAETLALLRAGHEKEMLDSITDIKELAIDELEESFEALMIGKQLLETKRDYYESREFMNANEKADIAFRFLAQYLQQVAQMLSMSGAQSSNLPDFLAGAAGLAGPLNIIILPGSGSKTNSAAQGAANAVSFFANYFSFVAGLSSTMGQHKRRKEEWHFQQSLAEIELDQIEYQIAAAEIRKQIANKELQNHKQRITQAEEVEIFYKDKFTNQQLYNWMAGQVSSLYFQAYQMAYDLAKKAERAYRYELGLDDEETNFIQFGYWDSLKKGLLAGDKLRQSLRRMELAYLEKNKRHYELTKHFSLINLNPEALLTLRETGTCFFELPEIAFDMDQPGHYFRRIKSVGLTIPCVSGPYTSVSAKLTLLANRVRKRIAGTTADNYHYSSEDGNLDPRFEHNLVGIQSIATSHAQNDSGLFELNFRDERYLPFEGAGAISSWRLELPTEFRQFDYDTISDVILHLNYTARDGGESFKDSVNVYSQRQRDGWLDALEAGGRRLLGLINLTEQFPHEWNKLINAPDYAASLRLTHQHFPYFLRDRIIGIQSITLYFKPTLNELSITDAIKFVSIAQGTVDAAATVEPPDSAYICSKSFKMKDDVNIKPGESVDIVIDNLRMEDDEKPERPGFSGAEVRSLLLMIEYRLQNTGTSKTVA